MSDEAAQRQALAAGVVLVLVWGASFTIQKAAYVAMSPGGFLFGRSLLMATCAAALLWWRGKPLWPPMADAAQWRQLALVTLIGPVMHILLVTYGIHWSTAFSSSLIMALGPVFTLILLRLLRGTRVHRYQWAGIAAALFGVLLLISDKLLRSDLDASGGDLMLLAATVVFSLYTIWITPLVSRHGGLEVMSWVTLLASPVLLLLTLPAALGSPYASLSPTIWAAFLWTVLVSAFIGWTIWGWVNAVRGVALTAPLLYGVPPVAGLVAWWSADEGFGGVKLVGAAIALAGVAWTQFGHARRTPA